jgi:hypothetical protein
MSEQHNHVKLPRFERDLQNASVAVLDKGPPFIGNFARPPRDDAERR